MLEELWNIPGNFNFKIYTEKEGSLKARNSNIIDIGLLKSQKP